VLFSQDAHLYRADITVRVGRGILLQSSAEATGIYPAFDAAADKMGKRLRRHKRRLRDHHLNVAQGAEVPARQYVIESETSVVESEDFESVEGDSPGTEPVIIAEMDTMIETMSVAEAVMRMDLAELPALLFRSGVHGGLNMIYRRPDGHVGWIDPHDNKGPVAGQAMDEG
jgi:hypothetical protein